MDKKGLLAGIRGGLIVSCQARAGWPMHGSDIMAAFAMAAQQGGAVGIRANGRDDLLAIKKAVRLPLIGIRKHWSDEFEAYITPSWQDAQEVLAVGVDVIALDAGPRSRPQGQTYASILAAIRQAYPQVLVMAEVATLSEAMAVAGSGCDLLSTTLSGYTAESRGHDDVDLPLIKEMTARCRIPVIAEGHIRTADDAVAALQAGAWAVVVGTAITRPEVITQRFVSGIKSGFAS